MIQTYHISEKNIKYGLIINFTYTIKVEKRGVFYEISVLTVKNKCFYKEVVLHFNNNELERIKNKIKNTKKLEKEIYIAFGRCYACKTWIDSKNDIWRYDEYDIFCSMTCKNKPIADKCKCGKDIPRYYDWKYKEYCSIRCASNDILIKQTKLPKCIINFIGTFL